MDLLEATRGTFTTGPLFVEALIFVILVCVLGFTGAPLWFWTLIAAAVLWGFGAPTWLWGLFGITALVFNIRPVRRILVSVPVMKLLKALNLLPVISETERTALRAGTVWVEGELFSGKPDFKRLNTEPYPDLTPEERAFLDGPVEELCRIASDWEIHVRKDLPPPVWEFPTHGEGRTR